MIWNSYPAGSKKRNYIYMSLQIAGMAILAFLAYIFRGNISENGELPECQLHGGEYWD